MQTMKMTQDIFGQDDPGKTPKGKPVRELFFIVMRESQIQIKALQLIS